MEPRYLTVTALNRYVKARLDNDPHLHHLLVLGELSNVKYHYSGHCYFTLKDEKSKINAVMFSSQLKKVPFSLEDGMKVIVSCRLSAYEPQGTYQLYVENLQVDGLGNLYLAYEKRRLALEKEGLFLASHKKAIPTYASKIGVITAMSGAAIHDIVQTIRGNCPSAKIYFYPSLVQGSQAPGNLIARLKQADKDKLDIIIIGRGGGSLEDLWAFNDEALARTIYAMHTPIISGVGHESDVTICDFVADARAATPTAAARLATFNQADLSQWLDKTNQALVTLMQHRLTKEKEKIRFYASRPIYQQPKTLYASALMKLTQINEQLFTLMKRRLQEDKHQLYLQSLQLEDKMAGLVRTETQRLDHLSYLQSSLMINKLKTEKQLLLTKVKQLNAFNPLNVLERGYTLTYQDDKAITKKAMIDRTKPLEIQFVDGMVTVQVKEGQNEKDEL